MGKYWVVIFATLIRFTFKTHDAMDALENTNFEDNPSISSEYVKFLAMNSGLEALEEFTGKLKIMLDQLKDMQSSVKQADKKAENTVSFCDANKKSDDTLNKWMVTQEGKK
jgi:hypothetical protein